MEDPLIAHETTPVSIETEGITRVYETRRWSVLANVPVVAITLVTGSSARAWASNLALTALLGVYLVASLVACRAYFARPIDPERARRWSRGLLVSLAILALIYNAIFMNMARLGVPHAMQYLMLITAFFCAGGAAAYQYVRGLALVFIVVALIPQIIYYAVAEHTGSATTAAVLLVFLVFIAQTSVSLHRDAVQRMRLTRELAAAKAAAEHLARHDELTGLLNRRALFELGEQLIAEAVRDGRPLSVVLLDVDHFKAINDRHGHAGGDHALAAVADALRASARASDAASRIGGEEFAIVLPGTKASGAAEVADRFREAIRACRPIPAAPKASISASFGVAELGVHGDSLGRLLDSADAALYRAKSEGRDRVFVSVPVAS